MLVPANDFSNRPENRTCKIWGVKISASKFRQAFSFKSLSRMRSIRVIFIFISLWTTPLVSFTQPGDPAGDPDNHVPISGVEVLIGAGGLIGVKKIHDSQKKKT